MNFFRKLTMAALGISVVAALAVPAYAQNAAAGDIMESGANSGQAQNIGGNTLSQSNNNAGANSAQAPSLQGATNGTIGPQGNDATFVTGVNTAGTVRVNNLANLEAFLNIASNLAELGGIFAGVILAGSAFTANQVMLGRLRFSRKQRFAFAVVIVLI